MQIQELRIGNYVSHADFSDEYFVVKSITSQEGSYKVEIEGGSKGSWFSDAATITSIPLTAEMLESVGFKSYSSSEGLTGYKKEDPSKALIIKLFDDRTLVGHDNTPVALVADVHSLQNLYHSLTSLELDITVETV